MSMREWLQSLTVRNTSTEEDSIVMQNLLHRINFPMAIVTCGIVYLEGKSTIEYPPVSIHQMAASLLKAAS
jgi:hypothetical protein